ncbi:MAG TPA: hypothetical protein VIW03_04005 [Anaeromyxobacter sp.]
MNVVLTGSALVALLVAAEPPAKPDPAFAERDSGPGTIDVSAYPEQQKRSYAIFSVKCSKCHPLARPINSRFTAAEWKRYIKRMIRRPNSGINEEQAADVYEFLRFYSAQLGL